MKKKSSKTKDLPPKKSGQVKGGGKNRIAGNENLTLIRAAKPKVKKDLPPKKNPKGGKLAANENLTLIRAAKPTVKKDLPPKKNPKGGRAALKTR